VPLTDRGRVAAPRQLLGGVLDRLEEREPRLTGRLLAPHKALVDERRQPVERVHAQLGGRASHGLGSGEVEAAAEHGQPLEHPAGGPVEQLMAPLDRTPQGPLPLRDVRGACGAPRQVQAALEPLVDGSRCQEAQPCGRELDRQRHAAEVGHDRGHVGGVGVRQREARSHRAAARDEQPHGLEGEQGIGVAASERLGQLLALERADPVEVNGGRQARHGVLLLPGDPQRGSAGRQHPDARRPPEQLRKVPGRLAHLLEVVEHEQRPPPLQLAGERVERAPRGVVARADRLPDRRSRALRR
jgi:hypothetical protein